MDNNHHKGKNELKKMEQSSEDTHIRSILLKIADMLAAEKLITLDEKRKLVEMIKEELKK